MYSKILIIRFSSIGDVTQCLSVPTKLAQAFPDAKIHWVTRGDLSELLRHHPHIHRCHVLDRKGGFLGLWKLILKLRIENFTAVYDAHNNLRSRLLGWFLCSFWLGGSPLKRKPILLRRSQKRWKRFLLFKLKRNTYEMPFSGQRDLIEPLVAWGLHKSYPPPPQLFLLDSEDGAVPMKLLPNSPYIALAPSAAFFLKRWPKEHWKKLILNLPEFQFVLLGGPQDAFLDDVLAVAPTRVRNLAGKCTLRESAYVVKKSLLLVTNDTGVLHFAEQLGHPCLALMGPAPFGFPSRSTTLVKEKNLACRPCSKHGQGPCYNRTFYHECLAGFTADEIARDVMKLLTSLRT